MRNLLAANFMRLGRSRILWLCMAYMLYDGLRLFYGATKLTGDVYSRWAPSFQFLWFAGIAFALYCSFFISGEYADGGIRNKLIVGTSRLGIYLANLIFCTAACLLICAAYILPNWTLEYFFVGERGGLEYIRTSAEIALVLVECVLVVLSYNAIFLMIGMNIQHKTGGPIAVFLSAAALAYFGQDSRSMLLLYDSSPERYNFSPPVMFRHKLFSDWLPGGQAVHCIELGGFQDPKIMILHALVVVTASTAVGICLFQRKDLK